MKKIVETLGSRGSFLDFITQSCQYITSKSDFAQITEIEQIYQEVTGDTNTGFKICADTFAINEHWYDLNGSQMVYWIRNLGK